MEVVFTQDVTNKAHAGEVRRVADGYARNYLIPRGLAEIATPEVLKRLHKIKAAGDTTRIRETQVMEDLAKALTDVSVSVSGRVTPTGRYYGAVSSAQIAAQISAAVGRDIDRRLVDAGEPIREPGEYEVVLRLTNDIHATIRIIAEVEE
ncbi:MAG: 50S ribosomal protein L9 [Dehalococcoidia bacterium]|nr:50S ribosomal protein L9 [Dehalococcoidia bacterium]